MYAMTPFTFSRRAFVVSMIARLSALRSSYTFVPATSLSRSRRRSSVIVHSFRTSPWRTA